MYSLLSDKEMTEQAGKGIRPPGKNLHFLKLEVKISETILKIPSISKAITSKETNKSLND